MTAGPKRDVAGPSDGWHHHQSLNRQPERQLVTDAQGVLPISCFHGAQWQERLGNQCETMHNDVDTPSL